MGADYRIDAELRLVRMTFAGRLTDADLLAVQARLRRDPSFRPDFHALADATEVTEMAVTTQGLCGAAAGTPFGRGSRRAVVAPAAGVTHAVMSTYKRFRESGPEETEIFRDQDAALAWLRGAT